MSFTPKRSILNPHFEGYKLSFTPSPTISYIPLAHRATQSRSGVRALGFEQVASRIRHNHLAAGDGSDSAVYVSEDGNVVLVSADEVVEKNGVEDGQDGVSVRVVFSLPETVPLPNAQAEYPAAAYVAHDIWLVSDGHGRAYLFRTDRVRGGGLVDQLLSSWELRLEDTTTPFQLHSAALVAPHLALAIISTTLPASPAARAQSEFDVLAVRVPLPDFSSSFPSPDIQLNSFEVVWCRRGSHIPHFVTYAPSLEAFLLLGGSSYRDPTSTPASGSYEPSPDELASIPRAGEALDARPPPYSWTQTDDSVTIAFALPGTTSKNGIHATFETQTFSLRIGSPPLPAPLYAGAPLWDSIHPASSLWTWERGDSGIAGLLTVHLDKTHAGTRWSYVFAQGFETGPEVPETLDPSELAGIRASLEKYTATLQDSGGLGHGVPSLAEGERDNEVDSNVGHPVVPTWVGRDGAARSPANASPAVLLSLPLPGAKEPLSLVVKNDIDGPLYTVSEGDGTSGWTHTATYSALAFVLASKRDTRFTYHISSTAVLAFESGAREGGGGNVYVYRSGAPGDKWAKQSVFQLRPGAGALLGVGAVTSKTGRVLLLCLSERELTVCCHLF